MLWKAGTTVYAAYPAPAIIASTNAAIKERLGSRPDGFCTNACGGRGWPTLSVREAVVFSCADSAGAEPISALCFLLEAGMESESPGFAVAGSFIALCLPGTGADN